MTNLEMIRVSAEDQEARELGSIVAERYKHQEKLTPEDIKQFHLLAAHISQKQLLAAPAEHLH